MGYFTLHNVFLKTLRDHRAGTLAWSIGLAAMLIAGVSQYPQVMGSIGPGRAQAVAEMTKALQAFSFLTGEVTSLETVGGFITARVLGFVPLVLALWAALMAVGVIRGEEQQGTLDLLLSTPKSRPSVFAQKVGAVWLALAVATGFVGLGLWIGTTAIGEPLPDGGLLLTMLNIFVLLGFWGSVGLLAGQLVGARRKASGIVGSLLVATYLLNNIFEGIEGLKGLAWLMPWHYYSISKPLVPGRSFEVGGWLSLVLLSLLCLVLAAMMFVRRDLGAVFPLLRRAGSQRTPSATSNTVLLGSVLGKSLRDLLVPSIAWGVGIGLYGTLAVSTTKQAMEPLRDVIRNAGGWIAIVMGNLSSNEAYLSLMLFTYLPVLLAIYAITQIESWASDEEEGRLEMLVSMPLPRWQVLVARYVAMTIGLAIILAMAGAFILAAAAITDTRLDSGRVLGSLAVALPVGLVVAAFGLCLAAWLKRPSYALYISIGLITLMFFLETLAPIFNFPDAVRSLSIFHLYGRPLMEGIRWGGISTLVVAMVLFAVASVVGLMRRDIAK